MSKRFQSSRQIHQSKPRNVKTKVGKQVFVFAEIDLKSKKNKMMASRLQETHFGEEKKNLK